MNVKEAVNFLEMLQKLPEDLQKELFFMVKGAALVAEKSRPSAEIA